MSDARSRLERMRERLAPLNARYENLLRTFEWTWAKAAIGALILWFVAVILVAVIPSWWLYYANRPPADFLGRLLHLPWSQQRFWLFKLRDLVAVVLFTVPTIALMVIPYRVQKHRQRLRGRDAPRPSGGYR